MTGLPIFDVTPMDVSTFYLYIKEPGSSSWTQIKKQDGTQRLTKAECESYMSYALAMYKSIKNANELGSLGDEVTSDFGKVWTKIQKSEE